MTAREILTEADVAAVVEAIENGTPFPLDLAAPSLRALVERNGGVLTQAMLDDAEEVQP